MSKDAFNTVMLILACLAFGATAFGIGLAIGLAL
jgi:hypothetical protein